MIRLIGGYVSKRLGGKVAGGAALGSVLNVGFAAADTYSYRKEHKDASTASIIAHGALTFALWQYATPIALAWSLKDVALAAGKGIGNLWWQSITNIPGPGYRAGIGNGFMDTQPKATMRQRAVQALQDSKMRVNSVLGSEARRISRGYFEY